MKQVVITGVSTGIGYACVKVLLSREFRVYGSVRNQTDADRLQRDFGERFVPLLFDVTDEETVRAEAGCTQADLNHAAQSFGLAVPAGIISTTGIAGLTLGGGTGYLTRKYGLALDNLLEADVVLADGRFASVRDE